MPYNEKMNEKKKQHSIVVTISKNLEPLASEYDGFSKWTSSIDIDSDYEGTLKPSLGTIWPYNAYLYD